MEITVFAGPNGSGKSFITDMFKPAYRYINADDIQKALNCSSMEAAIIATDKREQALAEGIDFCFETVLSTDRNIHLLERAKSKGYEITVYYIITDNSDINVSRVNSRVSTGGHDVPVDKIRSRYIKAMKILPDIYRISDRFTLIDNSVSPRVMLTKNNSSVEINSNYFFTEDRIRRLLMIESEYDGVSKWDD